jgi:voltage-gated potassium channel Kch
MRRPRGRRRGFGNWWNRNWWIVLTAGGFAAFVLAFIGAEGGFFRRANTALQLLPMGFRDVSDLSWPAQIALFLAPLVFGYATLRAATRLFDERLEDVRAGFKRGHTVVCGLGGQGKALVDRLLPDNDVVVIERDPANLAVRTTRDAGGIVLIGDATDPLTLERAQIDRAATFFVTCGTDAVNAQVASNVLQLAERRDGHPPLQAFAHIADPRLFVFLLHRSFARPSARLEFFNVYERGAKALLEEARPREGGSAVVVGVGQLGQALVSEIGREQLERQRANGDPRAQTLRIHLVDLQAEAKVRRLQERYSRLADVCELRAHEIDIDSTEFDHLASAVSDLSVAYVCFDDDARTISATLSLLEQATEPFPVVARVSAQSSGFSALLKEDYGGRMRLETYRPVSMTEQACRPDVVLEGRRGLIARQVHESYRAAGGQLDLPWDELTDDGRELNRRHADDIARQLADAGYRLTPLLDWGAAPPELPAADVERMAQLEHERWMNQRLAEGWRYGPVRSNEDRINPDLVPWDRLRDTANARKVSRDLVRERPRILARAGIQVERD